MTAMRLLTTVSALAGAGVLAAGCGSGSSSDGGTTTTAAAPAPARTTAQTQTTPSAGASPSGGLKIKAVESDGLSFDKKTLTAKAGKVTITMDNPSGDSQPHAVAVEGNGVDRDGQVVQPGGASTVALDLKPGKYTFYCPVPGHRQAGMEGTLTVQ
jgi:uncharacterized cupredoxin-like copper-binding protein